MGSPGHWISHPQSPRCVCCGDSRCLPESYGYLIRVRGWTHSAPPSPCQAHVALREGSEKTLAL